MLRLGLRAPSSLSVYVVPWMQPARVLGIWLLLVVWLSLINVYFGFHFISRIWALFPTLSPCLNFLGFYKQCACGGYPFFNLILEDLGSRCQSTTVSEGNWAVCFAFSFSLLSFIFSFLHFSHFFFPSLSFFGSYGYAKNSEWNIWDLPYYQGIYDIVDRDSNCRT